eukprot:GHVR01123265.1.p1 GENE.GHVR01123265.1~~GHVR01123265.1.p1  ORF type:complete len:159 (+),score=16.57 GHVR01123265.1:49-477(+)
MKLLIIALSALVQVNANHDVITHMMHPREWYAYGFDNDRSGPVYGRSGPYVGYKVDPLIYGFSAGRNYGSAADDFGTGYSGVDSYWPKRNAYGFSWVSKQAAQNEFGAFGFYRPRPVVVVKPRPVVVVKPRPVVVVNPRRRW